MGTAVRLKIVTPERVVYDDSVDMVVARGVEGELGILYDHMPMVTSLKVSILKVKKNNVFYPVAISGGGFLEVQPQLITVLADSAELPDEIDLERAYAAKKRAEERLARKGEEGIDEKRASIALQRALTRIRVAEKQH